MLQYHHLCGYAKPTQSDLEVKNLHSPPTNTCIPLISRTALSAGQLLREMHTRLILSISGVYKSS